MIPCPIELLESAPKLVSYMYCIIQPSQIDLNPLLANLAFHRLWNFAQINLIDLIISVYSGQW
jgi:hypothetical protein